MKKINIDEIEVFGGGSRIPKVREIIKENFPNKNLGSMLNEESISKGCAVCSTICQS